MKMSDMTNGTSLDGTEYFLSLDGGQNVKVLLSKIGNWIAKTATFSTLTTNVKTLVGAINLKANSADLATVATSGKYSDLTGKPSLATVATSGSYGDLSDKPVTATQYFDGSTTSINSLNGDGVSYRGYIYNGSTDHDYLGWYGNCVVECIGAGATQDHVQRITRMTNGDVYFRYSSTSTFTYNLDLISASVSTKNVVSTFSSRRNSGGTVTVAQAIKSGRTIHMCIKVKPSADIENGGSVTSVINSEYLPVTAVNGVGYYGTKWFIGRLTADGSFTMRNTSGDVIKKDIEYQIPLVYICQEN